MMEFGTGSRSVSVEATSTRPSFSSSLSSAPDPDLQGYDHITWYVGNAKQAASYYVARMGFKHIAYRGLETGSRTIASHVVSNGRAVFVLTSPTRGSDGGSHTRPDSDSRLLREVQAHINLHGDAVKDVAFAVDDVEATYAAAVAKGAVSVQEPCTQSHAQDGQIITAVIKTFGHTTHTLVDRSRYKGCFLPGFRAAAGSDPLEKYLPTISVDVIDHFVGNQDWDLMEAACE
jgi:4-hydroxyphenylpyruvate dioxygenase